MSSKDLLKQLCAAIKSANVEDVRNILSTGEVDINRETSDWYRTRPIILAAAGGHRDIIATLLDQPQLDPNLCDGLFGNTALIDASHAGNTDVVQQLILDKRYHK